MLTDLKQWNVATMYEEGIGMYCMVWQYQPGVMLQCIFGGGCTGEMVAEGLKGTTIAGGVTAKNLAKKLCSGIPLFD